MKLDRLVFYNAHHFGDLHVSQELVKAIITRVRAESYEYFHIGVGRDILWGLPEVEHKSLSGLPINIQESRRPIIFTEDKRTAYVNTWYGASPSFIGIASCTLKTLYNLFLAIAFELDVQLPPLGSWAIPASPSVVFNGYDRALVLIANCMPMSEQATEIDLHAIVDDLVRECPRAIFMFTNPPPVGPRHSGALYVDEMFGTEENLRECVVVADHADVIVGQSSGPYTFALNKRNLLDSNKTFICFCKAKRVAHWAGKLEECKTYWEPRTDLTTVKDKITTVVNQVVERKEEYRYG